jgi:hypothetical protein
MKDILRPIVDVMVAVLLLVALVAVFRSDKAPATTNTPPPEIKTVELDEPAPEPVLKPLKLAVTYCPRERAEYDDIGKLLRKLGQGYEYSTIHLDDLADYDKIAQFDVVFATCGTYTPAWLGRELGVGVRQDTVTREPNFAMFDKAREALRRFVASGKTLYVSDQMYSLLAHVFQDYTSGMSVKVGDAQTVQARVVDPGLSDALGQELSIKFDLPDWYPALFRASDQTVYLEGTYRTMTHEVESAPLLIKLPFEQGALIFTSFHNEKQNSDKEEQLLRYLVFATVTAKEVTKVTKTMMAGGFSPQKSSLLSASAGNPTVTQTYKSKKAGRLQFVLGFEDRGARLMLSVVGPDGKAHEKEGNSTFTVEVKDAPVGAWKYTVTAVKVPYENFPFTLTVGEE